VNAQLQMDAMRLGAVTYLHDDEIDLIWDKNQDRNYARAWQYCWHAAKATRSSRRRNHYAPRMLGCSPAGHSRNC
jgi:hypothetical protein